MYIKDEYHTHVQADRSIRWGGGEGGGWAKTTGLLLMLCRTASALVPHWLNLRGNSKCEQCHF